MKRRFPVGFSTVAASLAFALAVGRPAAALAQVADVTFTRVPADTKITIIGEDRSDRVEGRTGARDADAKLVLQLQRREWPSGKYILTIWEPIGNPVSELISLEDGANLIDLTMILGDPISPIAPAQGGTEAAVAASVAGGTIGGLAPGVALGGRRSEGVSPRNDEYSHSNRDERDDRGARGNRAAGAAAIGTALLGTLVGSLFGGASAPPPAPEAQPPVIAQLPVTPAPEYVLNKVLATVPLADLATMQTLAQAIAADHNLNFLVVNPLDSVNLGLAEFTILDALDPAAKATELAADPRVESSQPEFIYQTTAKNEQLFYGPRLIRADNLPAAVTGKGIKVALIDTGVDGDRPELKGKISERIDMTGKGVSADVHGTMLAGIIVADRSGGIGIAPSATLLAIKSCQANRPQRIEGTCWSSTLSRGVDHANTTGARVINLSVGGPQDKLLARLVDEAVKRKITVVAAAGNDGPKGQPRYPAALDNVIAVTAVDIDRQLYRDATRGKFIDVSAPGVEIVSIGPGVRQPISSGTSFAAAFVSGTIALMLEQRGSFSPPEIQIALERSARDLGAPGKDDEFGSGLVDVCQAIGQLDSPNPCR